MIQQAILLVNEREAVYNIDSVIVDPDLQVRQDIMAKAEALAPDIAFNGLQYKPKCRLDGQGRPHLFQGHVRFFAIKCFLKWPDITVDVSDVDEKTAVLLMMAENQKRSDYTPIEEGKAYTTALAKGWTVKELARAQHHTPKYIEDRLALLKTDLKVQAKVQAGKVALEVGVELAKAPLEIQDEICRNIDGQRLSAKEAKAQITNDIEEHLEWLEFKKRVEASRFKTCPTCKGPAFKHSREGKEWVTCQEWDDWQGQHVWSLKTGKTLGEKRKVEAPADGPGAEKKPRTIIRAFRYQVPIEVIRRALVQKGVDLALRELKTRVPKDHLTVQIDDWHVEVRLDVANASISQSDGWRWNDKNAISLSVERKIYSDRAKNKTKITPGSWARSQTAADKDKVETRKLLDRLPLIAEYRRKLKGQGSL